MTASAAKGLPGCFLDDMLVEQDIIVELNKLGRYSLKFRRIGNDLIELHKTLGVKQGRCRADISPT